MCYDFRRWSKNLLVLHRPLFKVNEGNEPEEKMAVQSQA